MLVLSRKRWERVRIKTPDGTVIWVTVTDFYHGGTKCRLSFEAAKEVEIMREELLPQETTP